MRKTREHRDLGYGNRMKPNQMIGFVLILAAVVCFWVDTIDKAHSDWKLVLGGIGLVLSGMWVGKFRFTKNQEKLDV
jgi:hypothetical protein